MKYALVIADAAGIPSDTRQQALSSYALSIEQNNPQSLGVSTLNGGTHLCNLTNGLSGVLLLLTEAHNYDIHLRVLFSENDFSFVPYIP